MVEPTYTVKALDAAGNRSVESNVAEVATPAAPLTTVTFAPVADARVEDGSPSSNFGTSTKLQASGGVPKRESYLRFQLAGSMLCALFTSVVATVAATEGAGPFHGLDHIEVMIKLQAFNGAMALTALLLSAVITEQRNTRRSVERACQELVEVLEHLTAGNAPRGGPTRPNGEAEDGPRQPKTGH